MNCGQTPAAAEGVEELAAMGLIPAGTYTNQDYLQGRVEVAKGRQYPSGYHVTPETSEVFYWPLMPPEDINWSNWPAQSVGLTMIGRVLSGGTGYIKVSRGEK